MYYHFAFKAQKDNEVFFYLMFDYKFYVTLFTGAFFKKIIESKKDNIDENIQKLLLLSGNVLDEETSDKVFDFYTIYNNVLFYIIFQFCS